MRVRLLSVLAAIALFVSAFSWFVPTQQASAAPSLKSVSASGTVIGGGTIQVKVVLTEKAPSGGTTVTLKSNRPSIVPVPASIKVPAGQTTAYANGIVTKGTQTSVVVTITGKLNGVTQTGETLIRAPYVADVYGSKSVGPGENSVNVRIAAKAGVGGMTLNLKSSRPSSVIVPDTIKVPEGETTIVLPYTIGPSSKGYTFSITVEALDKGADVVPAEKVVKPIQFFITYTGAPTPTPTKTATKTATPTKTATSTVAPPTATNSVVPTSTNTVAAPTETNTIAAPTETATTVPPTATATNTAVATATINPYSCGSYFNSPQADVTQFYSSVSDQIASPAVLRITNTSGKPFNLTLNLNDYSNPIYYYNQTVWTYAASGGFTWTTTSAQTVDQSTVTWDVSCSLDGSVSATSTPNAAPTSTATNTAVPATATATPVPPTATASATALPPTATPPAVAVSEACQVVIDGEFDQSYPGWYWGSAYFDQGETVLFTAGGSAFNLDIYALSISQSSITTYTWVVPYSGPFDIQMVSSNSSNINWNLDCTAAGS